MTSTVFAKGFICEPPSWADPGDDPGWFSQEQEPLAEKLGVETMRDGMTVIAHTAQDPAEPVSNTPPPTYWINS